MIFIAQLTEEIRDLGQRVLELENGFQLMQNIKDGKESIQVGSSIYTLSHCLPDFTNFSAKRSLDVKARLKEISPESEDYAPILALGMVDHDFRQVVDLFQMYNALLLISMERGNVKRINEILEDPEYFFGYENLRIGLATIGYVATGDKKFLVSVDSSHFPDLLRVMNDYELKCSYDFGGVRAISSGQYIAIHQLIKNSWRNVAQAKRELPSPDSIDDIKVKVAETDSHLFAIVKDNGTGILDDKLPLIFGGYTEGGTNVGLRVVKRILDLSGGYAEVMSTRAGQGTFKYDTKTNTVSRIGENQVHGTAFTLYFPNP